MKAFFSKKSVKIIISIILAIVLVVCVCNGYFASVAMKCQKGTAMCDEWNENMAYTHDYAKNIEIGDKNYKILCLTDIHIRNFATFAACLGTNFILDGMGKVQLKKLIKKEKPDLIIVGGDTVLTSWNDICTKQFCEFMEKFDIPWAPIFGNHDYEGRADKAKLAEIYESYDNCLFKSGPEGMDGMGNYIINLTRDNKPVYTLFMLDDGMFRVVDHEITYGGVGKNQIKWYEWAVKGIADENGGQTVPNLAFMHVPVPEYKEQKDNFKMGLRLEETTCATVNDGFFDSFKSHGGTHMYAGHDHNNNFISEKDGIELNYMTKSSYNCYFSFKALGATELTLDKDNNINEKIIDF